MYWIFALHVCVAGVPASPRVTAFIIYSPRNRLYKKLFFLKCFSTKRHLSLRAQKNFMLELTKKKSPFNDKYTRRQRKRLVSGHQDWDHTHRGWHFDSVEAKIKTDIKRTRTSAKYWKFPSKNILHLGKRYFLKRIAMAKPHFAQLLQASRRCRMQVLHKY